MSYPCFFASIAAVTAASAIPSKIIGGSLRQIKVLLYMTVYSGVGEIKQILEAIFLSFHLAYL
jgi:hypothetical protein